VSAFLRAPFAELAPFLADYGYHPVPIMPGHKAPRIDHGWQDPRPPEAWPAGCATWGTGILTATTPALDLDIRDRAMVRALIALAADTIGPGPFRIGAPPKALLPFSLAPDVDPFAKVTSGWYALPGDDWRAPGYAPHRVEFLAAGQQAVAYARHPRGTWYRWRRGEPMNTHVVDLPEVDQHVAARFVGLAEAVLIEAGAVRLIRTDGVYRPAPEPVPEPPRRTRVAGGGGDRSWQEIEPELLAKLIDPVHARRTRTGWITSCPAHASEGHRSLHITPRHGGGSVVHCYAECAFREIAAAISHLVGRSAA
jgi:hypothetical protein